MIKPEDLEFAVDQLATQVIYRKIGGEFGSAHAVLDYLQECQKKAKLWDTHQEIESLLEKDK